MIRYINQRDTYTCGVICVMNAIKWGGGKISVKKDRKRLIEKMGSHYGIGSSLHSVERSLREEGKDLFTVRKAKKFTAKTIREHLQNGGAVAVAYMHCDDADCWDSHIGLLVYSDGKHYTGVNVFSGEKTPLAILNNKGLKWLLRKPKNIPSGAKEAPPFVWFLTKKKKKKKKK